MKRSISGLLCALSLILLLTDCRKKAFDEFYGRPESLAPPIYQQLQAKGGFSSLLKVIDKTTYKETLAAAGSWTFFAPNDAAFAKFIQEQGIASVDAITPEMAEKIVRYSMIYDGEKSARLSSYFDGNVSIQPTPGTAFRRRTLYYDFVYDAVNQSGTPVKAIAANRNGAVYIQTDFNNKHIPIFLDDFLQRKGLSASDYQYFYPGSTFTGFNVGPSSVSATDRNIEAENGIIHVIDKVLLPPSSMDQYINAAPEYSLFKSLLDRFANYNRDDNVTRRYNVLTGKTDPVYIKLYTALPFSPNNENYLKANANDAQTNSYSMVVPNNQAVQDYAKKVLLKYYPNTTLDQFAAIRNDAVLEFVRAHMINEALWPSRFNSTPNVQSETITVPAGNVVDKKLLSNGMFYGTDKVQDANIFSSVYGYIYLDPKFSFFRAAIDRYGYTSLLRGRSNKVVLIPVSNALLNKMGFTYDPNTFPNDPVRLNGVGDNVRLRRIIANHVIDLSFRNGPAPVYSGKGFLLNGAPYGNVPPDEYIRYDNNRLYSSGTIDSGYTALPPTLNGLTVNTNPTYVKIDSTATGTNGTVLYASGLLSSTPNEVGLAIERNGTTATQPYFKFFQYLKNSALFNASTRVITGVDAGLAYTVFIPTNAAIDQAVIDGLLPASVTPTLLSDKEKVTNFIRYHILNKVTVAADAHLVRQGLQPTLVQQNGDFVQVRIASTTTTLTVTDSFGRIANVVGPENSLLSNRTVIHQIDKYLKFIP